MICHKRVERFSQTRYQRFCRHRYCQGETSRSGSETEHSILPHSRSSFSTLIPPPHHCSLVFCHPFFAVPILVHWRKRGKSACIVTDNRFSALLSIWLRTSSSPHRLRTTHTLACSRSLLAFISCSIAILFFFRWLCWDNTSNLHSLSP